MSRIGKQYISIPDKVNIRLEGQKVFVDGPKGKLTRILPSFICCTIDEPEKKVFLAGRTCEGEFFSRTYPRGQEPRAPRARD